jgi:DNA modification methylase
MLNGANSADEPVASELELGDIKPHTPKTSLNRSLFSDSTPKYRLGQVAPAVGMSPSFIKKLVGSGNLLSATQILELLDLDAFSETFIPRSQVLNFLEKQNNERKNHHPNLVELKRSEPSLIQGHALDVIRSLPANSVQTVVTSTPYWGMRIYKESYVTSWADGEVSAFGHEQTPEGFIRHAAEVLLALRDVLTEDGSIWWNVMDTYNTRTQIRGNASEALEAMKGNEDRAWGEYASRRYSSGHSFLLDGEQSLIPTRIAERASRMGFYVKSIITWAKPSTLPEPQTSRVSRSLEYIIHLTKVRTPRFNKDIYLKLDAELGGKNQRYETDKLSDVWALPTSSGRDGHGAQFPISLPARCIALSSDYGDIVLDPFVGSGNTGVAARKLGRRFIGVDVAKEYLDLAHRRISATDVLMPATILRD